MSKIPLGQSTSYASGYSPELLFAIPRDDARRAANIGPDLPFTGVDLWNVWELTWLDSDGKPEVATATILIDAESPNIIESKSLKLYLNSLAMTRYRDADIVAKLIETDLSATAGSTVQVTLLAAARWGDQKADILPGRCIDGAPVRCSATTVDPAALVSSEETVERQQLHSHLLRSLCPVTNQPDMGSILIRYSGPQIDESGLLQYLVSFRQHNDFHEACVERIFVDIQQQCGAQQLTVYARYNRRGGLDINPFRSNFEARPRLLRLWRQ